jgi:hypothetical protein
VENLSDAEQSRQDEREGSTGPEEDPRFDAHIDEADRQHLRAFPRERKATLMERILAREPDKSEHLEGRRGLEKTFPRLRRDGYALIDLQLHDTAFSSVWYRKSNGVLDWRRTEVTLVIWALQKRGPATTVQTWLL